MDALESNYTEFDPENPILCKIKSLENPALTNLLLPYVKFQPSGCVLPKHFNKYYEQVRKFPVENSDIWLVSSVKSGTVLAQEMVWLLKNGCDFEGAKKPLIERTTFFEQSMYKLLHDTLEGNTEAKSSFKEAEETNPRIIKTHLPYDLLPEKIRSGEKRPQIIYITRHPKDSIVSYYHHRVLFNGYKGSLDDKVEQFVSDMTIYAPYWTHVRGFWERRNEPNVLFLKYEDMRTDITGVIGQVAKVLDVAPPSGVQLNALLQHLSFEAMKSNPFVNQDGITEALIKVHGVARQSNYIRKGKVGGWKEELSPAAIQMLDNWIQENGIEGLYDNFSK